MRKKKKSRSSFFLKNCYFTTFSSSCSSHLLTVNCPNNLFLFYCLSRCCCFREMYFYFIFFYFVEIDTLSRWWCIKGVFQRLLSVSVTRLEHAMLFTVIYLCTSLEYSLDPHRIFLFELMLAFSLTYLLTCSRIYHLDDDNKMSSLFDGK